jgi:hypothetical protein
VRSLKSYGSLVVSLLLAVSSFNILVTYPGSFLWTPPYPSGFWGEYVGRRDGATYHFGYASGSLKSGILWLETVCEAIGVGGISSQACGGMGGTSFIIASTSSSSTSNSFTSALNEEIKKRNSEAIALLNLLEQRVEEAAGTPGYFKKLKANEDAGTLNIHSNLIISDTIAFIATASKWVSVSSSVYFKGEFYAYSVANPGFGRALYQTQAYLYVYDETTGSGISYLMNGIPSSYSKEIIAPDFSTLYPNDYLTLTAGFMATEGHKYHILVEVYFTAAAVVIGGDSFVRINFWDPGNNWMVKIQSIYLSY